MVDAFKSGFARLCAAALLTIAGTAAHAASFAFEGVFGADDDVALFEFTVGAGALVEIRTFGYGGGTMVDGTVVPSGGFDPAIWLFAGDGSFTGAFNEDWDVAGSQATPDPITGGRYDARISRFLGAGDYVLALTQYENAPLAALNPALKLMDGFLYDGQPHYTVTLQSPWCPAGSNFCDYWVLGSGSSRQSLLRNGNYAIQFVNVDGVSPPPTSRVPLPAALPMLASALLGLAALRRTRRRPV